MVQHGPIEYTFDAGRALTSQVSVVSASVASECECQACSAERIIADAIRAGAVAVQTSHRGQSVVRSHASANSAETR